MRLKPDLDGILETVGVGVCGTGPACGEEWRDILDDILKNSVKRPQCGHQCYVVEFPGISMRGKGVIGVDRLSS